jgi:hypothetical protein
MTKVIAAIVFVVCALIFFSGTNDLLTLGLSGLLGIASAAVVLGK